jgi:hypothetical protein
VNKKSNLKILESFEISKAHFGEEVTPKFLKYLALFSLNLLLRRSMDELFKIREDTWP